MELTQECGPLEFIKISDTNHQYFAGAIEIYTESFSPDSRQLVSLLKERIDSGTSCLYVGYIPKEVVFIAVLWPLKNTEFILLDYIATQKRFRSQGIGSAFMKELYQELRDSEKFLLIEVENPEKGERKEQKERRLAFYQRLGAKIMKGVRYLLPALDGSISIPTEMLLLMFPEYKQKTIAAKVVKEAISQIYQQLYSTDINHPLLHTIIDNLEDPVELV